MRLAIFLLIFCIFEYALAVDHTNFKTCDQSSFCRRCRKVKPDNSKFALVPGTLNTYSDSITADLIHKDNKHLFSLKLEALEQSNTFRLLVDEKTPLKPRYKVQDALKAPPKPGSIKVHEGDTELTITSGPNKAVVIADPFRVDFYQNDVFTVSVNAKGLMTMEYLRPKPQQPADGENAENAAAVNEVQEADEIDDPGAWEENFKSHHDSKPYGPEAVALDFSFPEAEVLFGIPEHADSFALKSTSGSDPYRLYNVDVFEYIVDSKMALYGTVPVLYGHGAQRTAGVFWQNAAETWVDIYTAERNVVSSIVNFVSGSRKSDPPAAHFMSESGIIDVFIFLGPTPLEVFQQYTALTGTAPLPQMFALGYHQSRWNYNDERDVEEVSAKFDEYDIPMDTMWLDIEYTDGKKYFTWDQFKFPNPLGMIKNLTDLGRHLVIIIDPHIKRDSGYFFHNDCTERGYYTKNRDGSDYEGWCWPGSASYPDFFNPEVRAYYASQYALSNFKTVTADVMFWNDMNEPSVFNGPEVTMLKDLVHYGNWEHRDVHNMYGHMHLMGTFDGILNRDANQRPFILTRAHFAGSQRYALIWTGDNMADWGHLQHSVKMCLSEAVAGFSFCGADIGGFFGNPDTELYERWYQTGAFLPFYRCHSHIDTKRREPWLFPEDTRLVIREALRKRYSYLPLWYTMFYEHELNGAPVMRPLLAHYPKDKETYTIDNEFLLQDRLLVRPVMEQGVSKVSVYFPAIDDKKTGDVWYDVDTLKKYTNAGYESIAVDNYKIPVFQRGGTIVPKKERIRRAATLMKNDPYTLVVCLDRAGKAEGTLYMDDEKSYKYRDGEFNYIHLKFAENLLDVNFIGKANYKTSAWIERVVIAGLERVPKTATLIVDGISQELDILPYGEGVAVRKPGISVQQLYNIRLNF
ncbi:neutral alpha-glucosidase AB isoform X1 [Anastrepha ludens]|uniref:neutral alpha-glucosidase AB isoform X1 n=1 Tax=Anastrepha ludens TaxID=28586 RepID=UPI0023B0F629|nr:neutral alpha-glucosidase AB isoform X1 [Anastrepha ludens]XP_053948574.1 neutral alpha-glucosidase AB isoform X1 [Anastrepha ludens]XP_053948575.1 neutral alpha-glucosidase AB isoform X1 [Anastrepha ludens]XP_053948576.1 neutral alpha-glucosidase AB isoform X1 [Anastrepha ludens]